ncbi:MAG: beta-lactamase family protein [Actinobacteria bacterium]|nr:beta-lactamase family protein [Actinomycetota bacterium]
MHNKRIVAAVLVFHLLALVPLCSSCGTREFDKDVVKELDETVDAVMTASEIPGVVAGVWIPDEGNWQTARGEADIKTGRRIELEDKFRIGSITKSFTATVILQLVDEDKIGLGDTVEKYIEGVPNGSGISIRQLLNMTSGLFNFAEDEGFLKSFSEDPLMEITQEEKLDMAFRHEPYFPPGEGFHNSETNYVLLGMIIEKLTGGSVESEIDKRIAGPLKLDSTSLPTTPDMAGAYSHSYVYNKEAGEMVDYTRINPSVPWAGGGMVSNMFDLRKWVKSVATGELLSDAMHKEQLNWTDIPGGEEKNLKYGLGVYCVDGFIGDSGALFGYNSAAYYLPEEDAAFVTFTNETYLNSQEAALLFIAIVKILVPGKFENL